MNFLTVTSSGFSISGLVHTTGFCLMMLGGIVSPRLSNGSLGYVFPGWTVNVTPTEDNAGVHFAIQFVNTGPSAAVVPDFALCALTGGLTQQWASNQTQPLILAQKLADGSYFAITVDDIDYPIVAELVQATNPYSGINNLFFHPTGGQYVRYGLDLTPISVLPEGSTTIHCSMRYGPTLASVSASTYAAWAQHFPYSLEWTDRRQMLRGDMFPYNPTRQNPQGCQCGYDIDNPAHFAAPRGRASWSFPECAPESWLGFCAPMVWSSGDVINWTTVPRNIYGDKGWGLYFNQDLTAPITAANFLADAKLGSTVLTDGGWIPRNPQLQAGAKILSQAKLTH